ETIINYTIIKFLGSSNLKIKSNREVTESMLNSRYEKIPEEILNLWQELVEYRNDINHGGWREQNFHTENEFRQKLKEFTERAKKLLIEINQIKKRK
ncbi:MAG: hypothetical protein QXO71_09160, partial [Candidatus Jordarchaeaceae archaeon]